jgi:hypothetical protein
MKWFGPDWGAPVCRSSPHVPTPVGAACVFCEDSVEPESCGFVSPHVTLADGGYVAVERASHLECFLLNVGAIKEVHVLHHGFALCGLRGVPSEWPDGHRWVRLSEKKRATCGVCKLRAADA